jgi:hypothetical protein
MPNGIRVGTATSALSYSTPTKAVRRGTAGAHVTSFVQGDGEGMASNTKGAGGAGVGPPRSCGQWICAKQWLCAKRPAIRHYLLLYAIPAGAILVLVHHALLWPGAPV